MTARHTPVRLPIRRAARRPLTAPESGTAAPGGQHRGPRAGGTRTALLTVALPSAATLGVFGVAAATVDTGRPDTATPAAAPDALPDTPPDTPGAGAGPRADRGTGRTAVLPVDDRGPDTLRPDTLQPDTLQPDTLRPDGRYALPVGAPGLSASFGRSGPHWAARHTGIDFPVATGTPVRAATDGTVTTGWSAAYGHLAIVTAADGTETWYAHLSGYRVRSGAVRAGEVVARSGATGNTTGPHLHFEVRPGGGAPVDPLPWLLARGLDPR
ncbi:hypothetical protein KNE206_22810 [Kitasatospora sp. NE20-6]|uniref:M23 family metallopeptidase n=1 Tax=Kitasatospora sp. NE20-6 TaxID=2859066 RepID=UPI0034DC158B